MVRLTTEYIVKHNSHTKRKKDEATSQYLKKLTHLYMSEKNIEEIDNLTKCRNLTVLYLYDNKLSTTMNLGTAPNLTHLYIQNNNISKLEDLTCLTQLTKLYLGHNNLLVIEGLQSLQMLKELHVEYQRLPPGEKLLFDPRSIFSISRSLEILNVSGNHLDTFKSLIPLTNLVEVQARDNDVTDFDGISDALTSWPELRKLDLTGNSFSHAPKYRDRVIVGSRALENLDGKEVSKMERQFLVRWKASRDSAKRRQSQESNNDLQQQQTLRQQFPPHSAFNATSQYIIKGLPGAQKRFEAILAKSRSLPNSAVAPMQRLRLHGEGPNGTVFQTRQGLVETNGGLNGGEINADDGLPHPLTDDDDDDEDVVASDTPATAAATEVSQSHGDVMMMEKNGLGSWKPMEGEEDPVYKNSVDGGASRLLTPYVPIKQLGFTGSKPHTTTRVPPTTPRQATTMFEGKPPPHSEHRRRYPTLRGQRAATTGAGEKGATSAPNLNTVLLTDDGGM